MEQEEVDVTGPSRSANVQLTVDRAAEESRRKCGMADGVASDASIWSGSMIVPPSRYLCALTKNIMRAPVVTIYGTHFERAAITSRLLRSHVCPVTQKPLYRHLLFSDEPLRREIDDYLRAPPTAPLLEASRASCDVEAVDGAQRAGRKRPGVRTSDTPVVLLRSDVRNLASKERRRRRRSKSNPVSLVGDVAESESRVGSERQAGGGGNADGVAAKGLMRSPSMEMRSSGSRAPSMAGGGVVGLRRDKSLPSPILSRSRGTFASASSKLLNRSSESAPLTARWYRSVGENKWKMYSNVDNDTIEEAYQKGAQDYVHLKGRGAVISVAERIHVSEKGARRKVLRATWFFERPDSSLPPEAEERMVLVPFDEAVAAKLEQYYQSSIFNAPVLLADKEHEAVVRGPGDAILRRCGTTGAKVSAKVVRGYDASDRHRRMVPQQGSV